MENVETDSRSRFFSLKIQSVYSSTLTFQGLFSKSFLGSITNGKPSTLLKNVILKTARKSDNQINIYTIHFDGLVSADTQRCNIGIGLGAQKAGSGHL